MRSCSGGCGRRMSSQSGNRGKEREDRTLDINVRIDREEDLSRDFDGFSHFRGGASQADLLLRPNWPARIIIMGSDVEHRAKYV